MRPNTDVWFMQSKLRFSFLIPELSKDELMSVLYIRSCLPHQSSLKRDQILMPGWWHSSYYWSHASAHTEKQQRQHNNYYIENTIRFI